MVTKKKSPAKKVVSQRSFVRSPNPKPFFAFRITYQTVYWLIITLLLLGLGIWVTYLSVKVETIYDQVEANGTSMPHIMTPAEKK